MRKYECSKHGVDYRLCCEECNEIYEDFKEDARDIMAEEKSNNNEDDNSN